METKIIISNIKNPYLRGNDGILNKYKGAYKKIFSILNRDRIFCPVETEDERMIGDRFILYFSETFDFDQVTEIQKIKNVTIHSLLLK